MIPLTLQYIPAESGPVEMTLADWGFTPPLLTLRSRGASLLTMKMVGIDPADEPVIPFDGRIVLWRDRTPDPDAGFVGGTAIFAGSRVKANATAAPEDHSMNFTFADAWSDLERTTFMHAWRGSPSGPASFAFAFINLFQDISSGPGSDWGYLTASAQIQEILSYAATDCGLAIQTGTIDSAWQLPYYPVKAITCAEAILLCIRSMPDMVTYFDYSTLVAGQVVPTLHIRQRNNLTALTLPFGGTDAHGRSHQSSRIQSREDLQPSEVVVQYRITADVSGTSYVSFANDAYPPGSNGKSKNAVVAAIDMRGVSATSLSAIVKTEAFDPTTVAFWQKYKPDLNSTEIDFGGVTTVIDSAINTAGHPYGVTIVDESGAAVSLAAFPRVLSADSAPVADWMTGVSAKKVIITAYVGYAQKYVDAAGAAQYKINENLWHRVNTSLTLTNAPLGTTPYNGTASTVSAEPIPIGLAKNIYDSAGQLQFEGQHVIVEDSLFAIIGPGNNLNLSGGSDRWSDMAAAIFETEIDFYHGRTVIQFGPHAHLDAHQFHDLLTMWTKRLKFENPATRNTGQDGSGGGTSLGNYVHIENTEHGTPFASLASVLGALDGDSKRLVIQHDATNGAIVAKHVSETGVIDTTKPQVNLTQTDLGSKDGIGRIAQWREFPVCDAETGVEKVFRLACTAVEDPA
jgi:hypothetical protein